VSLQSGFAQGSAARDKLVEQLLAQVDIAVPPALIEDEVHTHLEGEGRLEDDVHRAEVTEASEKQFRTQMLLDAVAEKLNVQVSQDELTQYLVQSAAQYGMAPQDFVEALQQNNQLPSLVGEVARNKAIAVALGQVVVVDTNGKVVDLTGFVATDDEETDEQEVVEEAQEIADAAAEADAVIEAEEAEPAPAKKRKSTKKAATAE
jgi:trigger factor